MLLVIFKVKKLLESLNKKKCKKQIQKSTELTKKSKRKGTTCMSNGKATIIFLKVGLIEKILLYKMSYFPKPYNRSKNKRQEDKSTSKKKKTLKQSKIN